MSTATTLRQFLILSLLASGLSGCFGTHLSTAGSQDVLSNTEYYLSSSANVRVYWMDSGLGTFVTQLAPHEGKLVLPSSLREGDYAPRTDNTTPRPLDLIAMVHYPGHPSGDFYFESPIFGPETAVTNVTTALSWYLRWGFSGERINLSQDSFNRLVLNIELVCQDCRKKTNSDVLQLLLSNSTLTSQIHSVVAEENPGLNLNGKIWSPPNAAWAWSDPLLTRHGVSAKNVNETDTETITVEYINPLSSTQVIQPIDYRRDFGASSYFSGPGEFTYTFSYDDTGTHVVTPLFDASVPVDGISFEYAVGNVNRLPVCPPPIVLNMRANMENQVSLDPFCSDPDVEDVVLAFAQSAGPMRLVIGEDGTVNWTPPQSASGLDYSETVQFNVTDSHDGIQAADATIQVTADRIPSIGATAASYPFTEATPGSFTVTASDPDGDPLSIAVEPITPIQAGYPTGAGIFAVTRTGTAGNYSFQIDYTPSYLQTIGADGTMSVRLVLTYESNQGFDSSIRFEERIVTLTLTNTDDPPVWMSQPVALTATEGVDLGGVDLGMASDPALNATNVTYKVVPTSASSKCHWTTLTVTKDGSGHALLWGAPPYNTAAVCAFALRATDGNGLYSDSADFEISVTDVNRPPVLASSPTTVVNGQEGKILSVPLNEMFQDPDLDEEDPREMMNYVCLLDTDNNGTYETNCLAGGVALAIDNSSYTALWTPAALSEGTYRVQLTATDKGGASVTFAFQIIVAPSPTAMTLTTVFNGTSTVVGDANEGTVYNLTLTATPASGRAIDLYDFIVNPPTCSVYGGGGVCAVNLVTAPAVLSGNGQTDFVFQIKPSYTDADTGVLTSDSKIYVLNFYSQKSDDASVYVQQSFTVTVHNTNRPPTAIRVMKGSFGCTGSSDNSDSTAFTVCVDAGQDTKIGNKWQKTYSIPLEEIDPDLTNDSYSYNFLEALAPGNVTNSTWTFGFPNCMNAGTGSFTRTYTLELADGRGGTVTRQIKLKVNRGAATTSCM
jgi:hypothetical protein